MSLGEQGAESAEARACVLMEKAGAKQVNPAHPELVAAIAEGITPETLAATVREAVAAGKRNPFTWAAATARARNAEGIRPAKAAAPRRTQPATPSPVRPEDLPRRRTDPAAAPPAAAIEAFAALGITLEKR